MFFNRDSVAQLAEQLTLNQRVESSNLSGVTQAHQQIPVFSQELFYQDSKIRQKTNFSKTNVAVI